jgi:hypothetical protein
VTWFIPSTISAAKSDTPQLQSTAERTTRHGSPVLPAGGTGGCRSNGTESPSARRGARSEYARLAGHGAAPPPHVLSRDAPPLS